MAALRASSPITASASLKVVVSERQQRGMLFAPIHWSDENASAARVGALVAPVTDPYSGQPETKATPAAIAREHRPGQGSVAHHDRHRHQPAAGTAFAGAVRSRFIRTMRHDSASSMTVSRASPPTMDNASSKSWSASAHSAACCLRRFTGAKRTRPPRGSARWWRRSPIRFPASPRTRRRRHRSCRMNMCFAVLRCRARRWNCRRIPGGRASPSAAVTAICSPTTPIWRDGNHGCARSPATISPNTGISAAAFIARRRLPENRIETCLFVGPAHDAGDWEVVKKPVLGRRAQRRPAPDVAVGYIDRRAGQRRADRLRLFRRRPRHDLRRHRGRREFGRRDRRATQGRHQLRLVHSGIEAA